MSNLGDALLHRLAGDIPRGAAWRVHASPPLDRLRVSVLVPALNEEESLSFVLPRIPLWIDEVILVDGHSVDRTIEVTQRLCPQAHIVAQEGRGKGAALRSGFKAATGDLIVTLDADGSMDPGEIPCFVGALLAGADYVKGSRFVQGAATADMPVQRRLVNWCFVKLANTLFGTHYTDITYGYNAVWREHTPILALELDGWEHEIIGNIRAARAGLRVVEVPCLERPRVAGKAKLKALPAGWAILTAMLREPFRTPALPRDQPRPPAATSPGPAVRNLPMLGIPGRGGSERLVGSGNSDPG